MFLEIFLPVLVCLLPALVLFFIELFVFKFKPLWLLFVCLMALLAILPVSLVQFGISYIPNFISFLRNFIAIPEIDYNGLIISLIKSLVVYSLLEEANKCLFMSFIPKKDLALNKILMMGLLFGLVFGCFESVIYFLDHLQMANSRGAEILYSKIFVRIFTADIIHMTCAGVGALFVYKIREKFLFSYIFAVVMLHGMYDFFAGFNNKLYWFIIPILILSCLECRIKYKNLQSLDVEVE